MKKQLLLVLSALFFVFNSCTDYNKKINVMTYNIRLNTEADSINKWDNRKEGIVSIIKELDLDIIGIQEALPDQIEYLSKQLKGYDFIGEGRDGENKGEFSAIFYNNKNINLEETETFWLSETPETPSIGWDAALNRIVTLGVFKVIKSNKSLIVYNTHFDHIGKKARENSANLILNKINENNHCKSPLIVMGDLNAVPSDKPVKLLSTSLEDSFYTLDIGEPYGTFNSFDINDKLERRIDYIFTKNLNVTNYRHIKNKLPNKLWPSDHIPVLISID